LGTLTLRGVYIESMWRASSRRHFMIQMSGAPGATSYMQGDMPAAFADLIRGFDCGVTITNVDLMVTDADSGGGIRLGYPFIAFGLTNICYLREYTTTAGAYDAVTWENLELSVQADQIQTGAAFLWIGLMTGMAATDIFTMTVRGYLEANRQQEMTQPVTLEGYKWPLVRR